MKNPTKEEFEKAIKLHITSSAHFDLKEAAAACYEIAKQMQPKWIPVSEQKPEISKTILLWFPDYLNSSTGWFNGREFTSHNRGLFGQTPTHWQELPSPPSL